MNPRDLRAIEELEAKLEAEYRAAVRREHRQQYVAAVLSEPGESAGPNSYPVPWMWTDIYRYAPSELSLLAGEFTDDPDGDAWYRDMPQRWAQSKAAPVPWAMRHVKKLKFGLNRRQRARRAVAS